MLKRFWHWLFPQVRVVHADPVPTWQHTFELDAIIEMPAEPLIEVSLVRRGYIVWQPRIGLHEVEVNLN